MRKAFSWQTTLNQIQVIFPWRAEGFGDCGLLLTLELNLAQEAKAHLLVGVAVDGDDASRLEFDEEKHRFIPAHQDPILYPRIVEKCFASSFLHAIILYAPFIFLLAINLCSLNTFMNSPRDESK